MRSDNNLDNSTYEDTDKCYVPIWEKYALTIVEASVYFRIGQNKLRKIVDENYDSDFVIRVGNRSLIIRQRFEEFLYHEREI